MPVCRPFCGRHVPEEPFVGEQQLDLVNEPVTHVGGYAKGLYEVTPDMCPATTVKQVWMLCAVAEGGVGGIAVGGERPAEAPEHLADNLSGTAAVFVQIPYCGSSVCDRHISPQV